MSPTLASDETRSTPLPSALWSRGKLRIRSFRLPYQRRPTSLGSALGTRGARGRNSLHSASAETAKAPYPLLPSSLPTRTRSRWASSWGRGGTGDETRFTPLPPRRRKLRMAQATLSCRYAAIHLVRSFRLPLPTQSHYVGLCVGDARGMDERCFAPFVLFSVA